jgi:nicotinamidase-related amidase
MSTPSFVDAFSQQFTLDPAHTALLIIDMQNATGNRHMGLGQLLAEQGNSDSAQYRFDRIEQLLIPNIQKLIEGFRTAGASIIWITYGANARDASDAPPHIAPIIKATNNIAGQPEHEVVDALKPGPDVQYRVVVASDGTGTDSEEMQQATLTMLKRLWARVLSTDEILAELQTTGDAP